MIEILHKVKEQLHMPVEEAYKVLRTNIQFCGFDKNIKTIAVTSYSPGEGKTTTSINLAMSMAKSGLKTLLVDADLRKPMLAKHLGDGSERGLTNLISGSVSIEDIITRTEMENFYFIACGPKPPNPAEIIGSSRFGEFVEAVRGQFDMVIFDTPPLGSVIDCAILSAQVDGTVLVIASNTVEYANAQKVKEQLEKVNARILGVVLNKMKKSEYRYYYNYYYNYGSSENRQKGILYRLKKIFMRKGQKDLKGDMEPKVKFLEKEAEKKKMSGPRAARKGLARG